MGGIRPRLGEGLDRITSGCEVILLTWLHEAHRDVQTVQPGGKTENPPRGVFLTRSPDRPNPIGLHCVEVVEIETPERIRVRPLEVLGRDRRDTPRLTSRRYRPSFPPIPP